MKLFLEKESDNEYDKEAIQVLCEGLGKIGYVANSPIQCWVNHSVQEDYMIK